MPAWAASPEAGGNKASQMVTPLVAAAQRAVTRASGPWRRAAGRELGRALGTVNPPLRLFGQAEYERTVLPYPTPHFGKGSPQNWGTTTMSQP